jgi:hypothetical protein
LLDDLHALVQFAQAGSIAGAADRLFRTSSAITRQLLGLMPLDADTDFAKMPPFAEIL